MIRFIMMFIYLCVINLQEITCVVDVSHNTKSALLTVAQCQLCFNDTVTINNVVDTVNIDKSRVKSLYYIDNVALNDQLKRNLDRLVACKSDDYAIAYKELKGGIEVSFCYNPSIIECCIEQYDTIEQRHTVLLSLRNKALLNKLAADELRIIRVA